LAAPIWCTWAKKLNTNPAALRESGAEKAYEGTRQREFERGQDIRRCNQNLNLSTSAVGRVNEPQQSPYRGAIELLSAMIDHVLSRRWSLRSFKLLYPIAKRKLLQGQADEIVHIQINALQRWLVPTAAKNLCVSSLEQ
jgi:hypothetical protein